MTDPSCERAKLDAGPMQPGEPGVAASVLGRPEDVDEVEVADLDAMPRDSRETGDRDRAACVQERSHGSLLVGERSPAIPGSTTCHAPSGRILYRMALSVIKQELA
jgi:hypothetical protein